MKKLTEFDKERIKERFNGHYPAIKGKKRKLAELLVNPETDLTVSEICKEIGVSRQCFYNWQKETDFRDYVDFLIESYTDSELANVWKALIKKATKSGDVQAQKLYFELKDKYKQKIDVSGQLVIVDDLNA